MALLCTFYCKVAVADTFYPFVSVATGHEDNLFRLPDDQLQQFDGGADTYRSVIGGLKFERPVSRQVFSGTAYLTSQKYDHNTQLDYLGKDLSGQWHWFVAQHFEGHFGGSYSQTLAPFADFHSTQRNLRVSKFQYADGTWRFHPSWRWVTSYTKYQYDFDLLSQRGSNRNEDALTSGIDYLAHSGSSIGVQLRHINGSYPYLQSISGGLSGNGYVQDEAKLNVVWLATGTTQVIFLGGYARRQESDAGGRGNAGTNARLIANWGLTGKIRLSAQTWREFSAIDGALIDSALASGVSGLATWDVSAKVQATANVKREDRKFIPFSGATVVLSNGSYKDTSDTASVGLVYQPLRSLTVRLNAFREQRDGSAAAGTTSYKANGASLSVTQQF